MNDVLSAEAVLNAIREPAAFGGKPPPFWDEAMAARPEGPLPFLDAAAIPARRQAAGLPADRDPLLIDTAAIVAADPALSAYAWYLQWRVFVAPGKGVPGGLPTLLDRLGDRAGAFSLLLSLEFPPALAAWHRRFGYPPSVTVETVRQISCFELNHIRGRGRPGMYEGQLSWFATYLVDPYVRLGRFEFQLHPYGGGVSAWKREADGQVLALAEPGVRVADNGAQLDGKTPPEAGWKTTLEVTPESVAGFPIDPAGRILRKAVRLARADWIPCLRKGDNVLDMHIPAGGGMTWEAMAESFRRAHEFFTHHHPDRPFMAVVCGTWFLDPQLATLLPPDANPLRLQRAVHLYPLNWGAGGLWFVFQLDPLKTAPSGLPRDTTLRRVLAEFLEKGGQWKCGGMFLMKEDMLRLQEGLYRKRFDALRRDLGV